MSATKVLLIEQNPDNADAIIHMLESGTAGSFHVSCVPDVTQAARTLGHVSCDVVLLSGELLSSDRLGQLKTLRQVADDVPVVMITERDDEDAGAAALRAGAQDYLVRSRINGDVLRRVIRYSRERTAAQKAFEAALEEQQRHLEVMVRERTSKLSQEIADRIRVENALRHSQNRVTAITENLFEGVLVTDLGGHIVFSNRSARILLGSDTLDGLHVDAVLTIKNGGHRQSLAQHMFAQVMETGRMFHVDEAIFQIGDHDLVAACACAPLLDDHTCRGVVISFRDIRALKVAQQEAFQASKLASVGQLAAGVAHEINTPTQYIGDNLSFVGDALAVLLPLLDRFRAVAQSPSCDAGARAALQQAVDQDDLDYLMEQLPQAVDRSQQGIEQVARIVLAMKEFSHPGTREKSVADINHAIQNTLAVSRNEWKHLAEIHLDLDPDLPQVVCLPGEINQVLLNMIVNAAHAIQSAHLPGRGRIEISTRASGDMIDIRVADNGIGMSEQVVARIFDPFFTTKAVRTGTGLGLAVCRDVVVNKHGGRIAVDSQEGKGTAFTVTLPMT